MTSRAEIGQLTQQIRAVLLNKPIAEELKVDNEELLELQGAVDYIANCMREVQSFLGALCEGRLNVSPPGRHNFTASYLKELHSILRHLTWQTTQVANGDYSQHVRFLGEFSDSFNILTAQLRERELSISEKTDALTKSMSLLKIVLDAQQDWVVVTDLEQAQVIYVNASAKHKFFNPDTETLASAQAKILLDKLLNEKSAETAVEDSRIWNIGSTAFSVKSFPVEWESRQAFVHCICDVTNEQEELEQLQDMAFKDSLTDAYNRRYCVRKIERLAERGIPFSLVLFDLDGLKTVNDVQGHLLGDDYIVTVAHYAASITRAEDRLCRVGGDEFVLLLPECTQEHAKQKMLRLAAHLAEIEKPYHIAMSYGVVHVKAKENVEIEELLRLADEKMYEMKQAHRAAQQAPQ